jgi:hypothetical protein
LEGPLGPDRYSDSVAGDVGLAGLDRPAIRIGLAGKDRAMIEGRYHIPQVAALQLMALPIQPDQPISMGARIDLSVPSWPPAAQKHSSRSVENVKLQPRFAPIADPGRKLVPSPPVPDHHVDSHCFTRLEQWGLPIQRRDQLLGRARHPRWTAQGQQVEGDRWGVQVFRCSGVQVFEGSGAGGFALNT